MTIFHPFPQVHCRHIAISRIHVLVTHLLLWSTLPTKATYRRKGLFEVRLDSGENASQQTDLQAVVGSRLWNLEAPSIHTLPPARAHLLSLPQQLHLWGSSFQMLETTGDIFLQTITYKLSFSVTGLFHLTRCPQSGTVLKWTRIFFSCRLSDAAYDMHTAFYLTLHLLMKFLLFPTT